MAEDIRSILKQVWPKWEIVEELGQGAFATVYKAERHDMAGTTYAAIKVIRIPQQRSEIDILHAEGLKPEQTNEHYQDVVREYTEEIKLMDAVKGYTNIVAIDDYEIYKSPSEMLWYLFIRMELLTPLLKRVSTEKLPEKEMIKLGIDLCTALEVCESHNIVHRDIKPENIFINENGDYKLGDFGVAKSLEKLTSGLSMKGTPNYMAPELYKSTIDESDLRSVSRVDIYSLGMVLYWLANNSKLPFLPTNKQILSSKDRSDAFARRINGEAIEAPAGVSKGLQDVILKACAYEPEKRFENASSMKKALLGLANQSKLQEKAPISKEDEVTKPKKPVQQDRANGKDDRAQQKASKAVQQSQRKKRKPAWHRWLAAVIVVALVAGGLLWGTGVLNKNTDDKTLTKQSEPPKAVSDVESTGEPVTEYTDELTATPTAVTAALKSDEPEDQPTAPVPTATEDANAKQYDIGLMALRNIDDSESVKEARDRFAELGAYKQASYYKVYSESLLTILLADENVDQLDSARTALEELRQNPYYDFESELQRSGYLTCSDLIVYVNARQKELEGDVPAAIDLYGTISILDSSNRKAELGKDSTESRYWAAVQLYNTGSFNDALNEFEALGDYRDSGEMHYKALLNHLHEWSSATCTEAAACAICGKTSGEALGHASSEATCTEAGICTRCGAIIEEALGHDWAPATCTDAKRCTRCGATNGEALGHNWIPATCTDARTCTVCGLTSGTALGHKWNPATCTDPKTCIRCKVTDGEPLDHDWSAATCTDASTCARCGLTSGTALGHNWSPATCTEPRTCTRCGATEGKELGHDWSAATCTDASTCKRCGMTDGAALGHDWKPATCTEPRTCTRCGATEGKELGHDWSAATCTDASTCARCGLTSGTALGHNWSPATCTEPRTCTRCGATEGKELGHDWSAATCTDASTCKRCGMTDGAALGHDWKPATCTEPRTCTRCGATEGKELGHDWAAATYSQPETCTRCRMTQGEPLPKQEDVPTNTPKPTSTATPAPTSTLQNVPVVGKTFEFGRYEQDNNTANGKDTIEWIVLDVQGDKALLLSRDLLEWMYYNEYNSQTYWAKSDINKWLNNEFATEAFNDSEKQRIVGYKEGTANSIFLLSEAEVRTYLDSTSKRMAYPSAFCKSKGAYPWPDTGACYWWLRDNVTDGYTVYAKGITGNGDYDLNGKLENQNRRGIRPAIWMYLSNQ